MKKRIIGLLLLLFVLSSCASEYHENLAKDSPFMFDERFNGIEIYEKEFEPFVILPVDENLIYSEISNNEIIIRLKSNITSMLHYVEILKDNSYKTIALTKEMNDRIATYLHPTGWRVAIYDNRRNNTLRDIYETDEYIYEVRIKKIQYDRNLFTKYPQNDTVLEIKETQYQEFDVVPTNVFSISLPDDSVFVRARLDEYGLYLSALTTYKELKNWESYVSEIGYKYIDNCYADEQDNYFFLTVEPIFENSFYKGDLSDLEVSENLEGDALVEYEKNKEDLRQYYELEELPKTDEEITVNTFCRIKIQFVRSEWIPEWWPKED